MFSVTSFDGTDLGVTVFTSQVSTPMSISKTGLPVACEATVTGRVLAPVHTITQVVTPVAGLDGVCDNFVAAVAGRDFETDTDLRLRRLASVTTAGSATVDAMTADLLQVSWCFLRHSYRECLFDTRP